MRAQLTPDCCHLLMLVAASEYGQGSNDSGKGWFQLGKEVQSVSGFAAVLQKSQSNDTLSVGKLNVSVVGAAR